ncbi:MAG: class I SAM-dependent methyltransferase [Methanobacterium sp.]|uniref:class I SAM-dependent methyltransferase n=1 Tax=Methanobacterium sp. TaxID=2164 RepID=UPI003C72A398
MNNNNIPNTKNIHCNSTTKKIEGPIFIGRTWKEYLKMFDLSIEDLVNGKILDCAAGASSFTAEMSKRGYEVMALDILYDEDPDVLCDKYQEHMKVLIEGLASVDSFIWNFFPNIEDLKEKRDEACREFIEDYRKNMASHYIKADLTNLPFPDNTFSMVLCSHLLFIYDHRLDYKFHLKTIEEMIRVSSNEVRIYPLVKNRELKSDFVKCIIKDLQDVDIKIVKVDYEFRKGGNEMMRIIKN